MCFNFKLMQFIVDSVYKEQIVFAPNKLLGNVQVIIL